MRGLLWLLALFALAVGVALAMGHNAGYVLLVLPPWRAEVSLNLFAVALLAAFLVLYAVHRAVVNTLRLPAAVRAWRARKRHEKAAAALQEAVLLLFEGRYGHAMKHAALAHASGEAPGLAALVAARAAHALRDEARARDWLARAGEHDAARGARLMTVAELAIERRQFEEALRPLDALGARGQRHIAALRLTLRACREVGRWRDVLRVTRQLEKHRALTAEAAAPLKLRAHLELIGECGGDAAALAACWEAVPADERRLPRLAAAAARALIAAGNSELPRRIIESRLEDEWDAELAEHYGDCRGGDALGRIARAEKWLARQPQDARLLLALARMCRERELWGKAQSYFEASLAVAPSQAAWGELAALFDRLGRGEEANRAYRAAAALCRAEDRGQRTEDR